MSQIKDIISQLQSLDVKLQEQQHNNGQVHEVESCCICLEEMETKKNTTTLPCGHSLHLPCFMNFILSGGQSNNSSCPLCRGSVGFSDEIKEQLENSSQSTIVNRNNVMELTRIQKDIVTTLKENNEYVYTPTGIMNKMTEYYTEKEIRANCKLLVEGGRLNEQRGARGKKLYGYIRAWDILQ